MSAPAPLPTADAPDFTVHALPPFEVEVGEDVPDDEMHVVWVPTNGGPEVHVATLRFPLPALPLLALRPAA